MSRTCGGMMLGMQIYGGVDWRTAGFERCRIVKDGERTAKFKALGG